MSPKGRAPGAKNKVYPPLPLSEAVKVALTLEEKASGMALSKVSLAQFLDSTPTSSVFRDLVASSRMYGLTVGGINASEFSITKTGTAIAGADAASVVEARRLAFHQVAPFAAFLEKFDGKRVPALAALVEFLTRDAGVPEEQAAGCAENLLADLAFSQLTTEVKGTAWLQNVAPQEDHDVVAQDDHVDDDAADQEAVGDELGSGEQPADLQQLRTRSRLGAATYLLLMGRTTFLSSS